MAWSTTDIAANDIIHQDGVFAYNFMASGTIYKGQAVYLSNDNKVCVCTTATGECDAVGLATLNASNGEQVGVAGPGNICYACADSALTAANIGSAVYGDTDGAVTTTIGNAKKVLGWIVDNAATNASGSSAGTYRVCEILLV